jgi:hypothetical protein
MAVTFGAMNTAWDVAFAGQYKRRAIRRRMGISRDRVYEIAVTDPIAWRIVAAYVETS